MQAAPLPADVVKAEGSRGGHIKKALPADVVKAFDSDLLKAAAKAPKAPKGEGSRGGHVIGHTRSGKAVYAPSPGLMAEQDPKAKQKGARDHVKFNSEGFTLADHRDAAQHHAAAASAAYEAERALPQPGGPQPLTDEQRAAHHALTDSAYRHGDISRAHMDVARKLYAAEPKPAPLVVAEQEPHPEGSKPIGKTRSGKPIHVMPAKMVEEHKANVKRATDPNKLADVEDRRMAKIDHYVASHYGAFTPEDHADAAKELSDHNRRLGDWAGDEGKAASWQAAAHASRAPAVAKALPAGVVSMSALI